MCHEPEAEATGCRDLGVPALAPQVSSQARACGLVRHVLAQAFLEIGQARDEVQERRARTLRLVQAEAFGREIRMTLRDLEFTSQDARTATGMVGQAGEAAIDAREDRLGYELSDRVGCPAGRLHRDRAARS